MPDKWRIYPEIVAPGVRLYEETGIFSIADHAGWVEGVFKTREDAIASAQPCDERCNCE